jgi:TLC domain
MWSVAWEAFNAQDSWLPLNIPLIIWVGCFLYCYLPSTSKQRPIFDKWQALHNFHNCGGMLLALLSICFGNDAVFNERISILWSLGYFGVDLMDCIYRQDVEYTLHALFCVVLGMANYVSPVCRELRMNSKALMCELSSPFLHLSKRTRNPLHFAIFAFVFTLCRILWVPYMTYQVIDYGLAWYDYRVVFLVGFYSLNVFWYFKILRIIVNGARGQEEAKKE